MEHFSCVLNRYKDNENYKFLKDKPQYFTQILQSCQMCIRRRECTAPVAPKFPEPEQYKGIMFLGRAPNNMEDSMKLKGVGEYMTVFEVYLNALGLTLPEIHLTSALLCRGTKNRNPLSEEVDACSPFKLMEFALLPTTKLVVAMGDAAMLQLFGYSKQYTAKYAYSFIETEILEKKIVVAVVYHPYFLLWQPSAYNARFFNEIKEKIC